MTSTSTSTGTSTTTAAAAAAEAARLVLGCDLNIYVFLDESGSMASVRQPTIDAVNNRFDELKALAAASKLSSVAIGRTTTTTTPTSVSAAATTTTTPPSVSAVETKSTTSSSSSSPAPQMKVSLTKFRQNILQRVWTATPIEAVTHLTAADYSPNGGTPLYDAIGSALQDMQSNANVVLIVITDGQDTTSKHYAFSEAEVTVSPNKDLVPICGKIVMARAVHAAKFGPMALFEAKAYYIGGNATNAKLLEDIGLVTTVVDAGVKGVEESSSGMSSVVGGMQSAWIQQQSLASATLSKHTS